MNSWYSRCFFFFRKGLVDSLFAVKNNFMLSSIVAMFPKGFASH